MLKNFSMPMSAPKPLSVTKMRKRKKLHKDFFFAQFHLIMITLWELVPK